LKAAARVWHNQAILYDSEFFLDGNVKELERLAAQVRRFRSAHSLSEEVEFELNLVLEELFVNAIRHGGCEGMERCARVRLGCEGERVAVEFSDRGEPFDPTQAPEADTESPLSERRAGGLGIHLVRSIMQDVVYRRADDWNQVTMKRAGCGTAEIRPAGIEDFQ